MIRDINAQGVRLALPEGELAALGVDHHLRALREFSFENPHGQGVLHQALDYPLERPRPVVRVVAACLPSSSWAEGLTSRAMRRSVRSSRCTRCELDLHDAADLVAA